MIEFFDLKDNVVKLLSFGRVRLGESAASTLVARNTGKYPLIDLVFTAENPDVKILSAPRNLKAGEQEKIRVEWSPKLDSEFGLKCRILWKGDELRGEE